MEDISFEEYEVEVFSPQDPRNAATLGRYETLSKAEDAIREYTPPFEGLSAEHFLSANVIPTPNDPDESMAHIPPILRARWRNPLVRPRQSYTIRRKRETLPSNCFPTNLQGVLRGSTVIEYKRDRRTPEVYGYDRTERDWGKTLTAIAIDEQGLGVRVYSLLNRACGGIYVPVGVPRIITDQLMKELRRSYDVVDQVSDYISYDEEKSWQALGWRQSEEIVSQSSFQ